MCAVQRVTLQLTQLRCIKESDGSGGSEPYLWVTYFALGALPIPGQAGPVATITPAYDAFRTEFPNNVQDGQLLGIPPFISKASFDMDLDAAGIKVIGCVAVLMEEDETPDNAIIPGRIAYSKEIDKQLNDLIISRALSNNMSPVTGAETTAIANAVSDRVYDAISENLSIWQKLFDNQDDNLGFTFRWFAGNDIKFQFVDFPEIPGPSNSSNRFVLSAGLSVGPVPTVPVDLCAAQRAAVNAEKSEIQSLQSRVMMLQQLLHHATPQQKAAIVAEINQTYSLITQAEAELAALQAVLDSCVSRHHGLHGDLNIGSAIEVNPE